MGMRLFLDLKKVANLCMKSMLKKTIGLTAMLLSFQITLSGATETRTPHRPTRVGDAA